MASLVEKTAHTASRSCCNVMAEIWRSVRGSLSSAVLQHRSYSDERLDGRVPPRPEALSGADPLVDTLLLGDFPPSVPKSQILGADRPVSNRNSYPPRKWEGLRVGVPIANLMPQLTRTEFNEKESPICSCHHVSSIVAQDSCHDSPRKGFLRDKERRISSARGGGNVHMSEAIAVAKHRQQQGNFIDSYPFVDVRKRCSNQKHLIAARQVHDCIIQSGIDKNPYVAMTLLTVYVRYGTLQDVRRVFDELEKNGNFTWNIRIGGYAQNDHAEDVLELFHQMRQGGAQPGERLCLRILNACASPFALQWRKEVNAYIRYVGLESEARVGTALVQTYAQCGGIMEAEQASGDLLRRQGGISIDPVIMTVSPVSSTPLRGARNMMKHILQACRGGRNIHTRSAGTATEAIASLEARQQQGNLIDSYTFVQVLKLCSKQKDLIATRRVNECIIRSGMDKHPYVANTLLNAYVRCGRLEDARRVFDALEKKDDFTWSIMIGGYANNNHAEDALEVFNQMRRGGAQPDEFACLSILKACASPLALKWGKEVHAYIKHSGLELDARVGTALVHMYAQCGCITKSRRVFEKLTHRDVITWNAMIGAYAKSGFGVEAYRLLLQMQRQGLAPNAITYLSILNASASAGALEWVKAVHNDALKVGLESDFRVGNALVHMYAKSGSIGDARLVFNRMEKRDVGTWSIMIGALAQHGCGREALELFRKMNAGCVKPDETTFVAVLSACCHAGLVDDGRRLFLAMTEDYGIEPTVVHYTCMVDLLARAGHLEEAKFLIDDMPVEPNGVTWKALLGACRTYGHVELGELAGNEVLKLEPKDAAAYVLLSNIYAAAGKWEKVRSVRTLMEKRGVRKEPGRSWIEVDNKIHEFVVGDTSHAEAKTIYTVLNKLSEKLKAEGYIPDTKLVLQDIHEKDKELALCSHSEKLAIGYGLLRISRGKPIRVYKNLRVCSDCHTATKFISKVTGREIIARDSNRFHHFKDGVCSCGDYW